MSMLAIRQASLKRAAELGFPTNPALPLLDASETLQRPVSAIVGRLLVLNCLAAVAFGFDRQKAVSWLTRETCSDLLSETESEFLHTGDGDRQQFADQVEGILALAWAVNITPELNFGTPCPDDLVFQFPNLKANEDSQAFRARAHLRSAAEVISAADLAYCLHWAIRDAQLKGGAVPGALEAYVTIERRRALEWLLSRAKWDSIDLDT